MKSETAIQAVSPEDIVTYFDFEYMLKGAWCAHFDNYDGAEDAGWQPRAHGDTKQEAIDNLLDMVEGHS